ncbi:MAG: hypothetical protein JO314_11395 [Acidobacteria bacterium]|nr:hypothetical protein [Acidobacteriota bacterium]
MTYSFSFESHSDFLKAHLTAAETSREITLAYLTELHEKCLAHGRSHLLVIRDIPVVLHLSDYFSLAAETATILQGIKTAWVNPHPRIHDDLEFFCLVANNRGAQYKLFPGCPQAEEWLGKERATPTRRSFPAQNGFVFAC